LVTPTVVGLVAVKCYNYSLDQFFLLVVVFWLEVIVFLPSYSHTKKTISRYISKRFTTTESYLSVVFALLKNILQWMRGHEKIKTKK
jgi:hypothetical protein